MRPTSRPPTNTAMTASTSIPYSPDPTPPGATSPSIMLIIGSMPPSAVYESCIEFTAPVEVSVVGAGEQRRAEDAEALLLALHRAARELRRGARPGRLERR